MKTLSFKEYLNSKDQLYDAIKKDPIHEATYEVYKYCRIVVGDTKELREYHNLKPKQLVTIRWQYTNIEELPDPIGIDLPHLSESTKPDVVFTTYQTGERLMKWLNTNTKELS